MDDLPAVLKASNYVLTQAGRPEMSLEQFRAEFSLPFTKFYDRHTPHVPMPQLEDWFHSSFRVAQASVIELPHARDFLEFCRAKKFRTFLLSTVHGDHFKVQCGVTGFDAYIDRPYTDVRLAPSHWRIHSRSGRRRSVRRFLARRCLALPRQAEARHEIAQNH